MSNEQYTLFEVLTQETDVTRHVVCYAGPKQVAHDWMNYLLIKLFVNWEIVHPREALGVVGLMLLQPPHQRLQAPPLRRIAHA
ncbi:hypothetical protein EYF80_036304 [Liparis tanakae]|uniref:Uncharacterized protein n=1 Tax=Liparis tanakae TaxID=230148 RepID=A0A4Z2GL81_9TELE|nr:hypothetical protein EYF80_036304 [Liparis tanakae]